MEYLRTARVTGRLGTADAAGEPGAGAEPEFAPRRSRRAAAHLDPAARRWPAGGGTAVGTGWRWPRGSRRARRWFGVLGGLWSFLAGFLGLLLLFLWFLTDHWSSRNNENVLLLTPISLVLVVLHPAGTEGSWRGRSRGGKGGHDRRGARSAGARDQGPALVPPAQPRTDRPHPAGACGAPPRTPARHRTRLGASRRFRDGDVLRHRHLRHDLPDGVEVQVVGAT